MNAQDTIKAVNAAATVEELDTFLAGEERKTVLDAIEKRRAALVAPTGDENESDEAEDGLVEVTTLGDKGTTKNIIVNGVASPIACGIVVRVTPEVAEQLRQCNLA